MVGLACCLNVFWYMLEQLSIRMLLKTMPEGRSYNRTVVERPNPTQY